MPSNLKTTYSTTALVGFEGDSRPKLGRAELETELTLELQPELAGLKGLFSFLWTIFIILRAVGPILCLLEFFSFFLLAKDRAAESLILIADF